jgi:LacI family transcriptional regulator
MVSIKDVAKRAVVSTATVSHVINSTRYVAEETKIKVFQAMKELDYHPNSVARSLRSRKSKIIGLLVPILMNDTSNFFFMSAAQGIESILKEHGYNLILSNTKEDITTELEQIRVFNSQLIDGLIMVPTYEEHNYLDQIVLADYPVVFIDRKPNDYKGDCILADGADGTYQAIHYLIGKGHQRIGFVTGALGLTTSDDRLLGYKKALMNHGIAFDPALVKVSESNLSSFASGCQLTKELMMEQSITALFVANTVMTMGALGFLQDQKIKIPEELAIIGFDDYEWEKITTPPLSVVKQPSYELGQVAARTLLKRIEQPNLPYEEVRLPTELIIRGSC